MSDIENLPQNNIFENEDELPSEEAQNAREARKRAKSSKEEPEVELTEEEKLRFKLSEMNDKFLRLYAEFDNYKKRTSLERIELIKTAGKDVIVSLLPILDDFDRALQVMDTASDINAIKAGVELVKNKFNKLLEQRGLTAMDCMGKEFDSELEEAITSIPAPSEKLKGKVIEVLEKGYLLNDKVIRFAKVIVGN
jgi:molecular chaperone GrpE